MSDRVDSVAEKSSLPPGSFVHVGEPGGGNAAISVFHYGPDNFESSEDIQGARPDERHGPFQVLWLRVRGVSDLPAMRLVGDKFGLHPLVLEDILNTVHRPKLEDFGDYLFLVGQRMDIDPDNMQVAREQVSLVLGKGWVISFEEEPDSEILSPMVKRLRNGVGRARNSGAAYLFYALLDLVADSYFEVLENLEDRLEELEEEALGEPDEKLLTQIYHLKRQVLRLRRTVWPLREISNSLLHGESSLIDQQIHPFLRDIYDHATQVLEASEALRESLAALMDLCLSKAGNRMNQVMKVLTVIATIFIPLTFMTGVYGMNFKHMPELDLVWAYPALLGLMALVVLVMIIFFKKKKWL